MLGNDLDGLNLEVFSVFDVDVEIVQADVGILADFIVGLEVRLEVIFGGGQFNLGGIFEDQGVLAEYVEKEGGTLDGLVLELPVHVGIDEYGDAGE
ncbi:unnamed protein product [Sphagnum balticum]